MPLAKRARRALVKLTGALGEREGMLDGISETGRSVPVGATLGEDEGAADGISEVGVEEIGAVLGAEVGAEDDGAEDAGAEEAGAEDNTELEGDATGDVERVMAIHPLMIPSPPLRRLPEQTWIVILVPSMVKEKLPEPKAL